MMKSTNSLQFYIEKGYSKIAELFACAVIRKVVNLSTFSLMKDGLSGMPF